MARRVVVFGTGAVGGALAVLLHDAGVPVICIARGAQLEAIRDAPLRLEMPSGVRTARLTVVPSPAAVAFEPDDVVVLATKTQDAADAIGALAAVAPRAIPIVCAQNGVAAMRLAAASFARVYGLVPYLPAAYLEPGTVRVYSEPVPGVLDVGVAPSGTDEVSLALASDLARAGFEAHAEPQVLRLAYGKLLTNLGNVLQALAGRAGLALVERLQEEALACYRAAGIAHAPLDELARRYAAVGDLTIAGEKRRGGSTWQSLARGTSLETPHLNGEIVRLGEAHRVATPLNRAVLRLAERAAAERWPPEHLSVEALAAALSG